MNLENGVLQVHIEDIIPNRFQPRLNFDEQGLKELADSIKEHGIIQPLVLRKLGNKYEIIAGERRYKAAQIAGLQTVPAVIANVDDKTSAEVALVENVQRRDLTAIEEARSYKSLLDKGYLTQEQLAKRMGLSQPSIANKLRLLNLDDEVQQALLDEKISERHARTLLTISDKNLQKEWLHRIINERLTVRQLDQELKKVKGIEEVPLVEKAKSIEEIKSEAKDLNPKKDLNIGEYKPKEEIETLDSLVDDKKEVSPIVETYDGNSNPISIETPSSTREFMNNEPTPPKDNKFFNLYDESETNEENNTNINNNVNSTKMEIYSDPSVPSSNIASEPVVEEKPQVEEKNNPVNDDYSDEQPMHFSADNVFFHPPIKEQENITEIKNETIDPMDVVKYATEPHPEEKNNNSYDLTDALNDIRDLISSLESKGFKIEVDEAALDSEYDINIKIKEDN